MRRANLADDEKEIENTAGKWKELTGVKLARVNKIIDEAGKTKNINIRINGNDLEGLKARSLKEGLPYQTLVASILHKYITDQLVDEQAVLKSVRLLAGSSLPGSSGRVL